MAFFLDEYKGGVDFVFSPTATLKVTHSTDVESEEDYQDCWDYARETHYTRNTGTTTYTATTNIKSIELMLDDDVYTVVKLSDEVIVEIKKAIEEAAAIHQALEDEGDNEPDYEYDEVA